MAAKPYYHSRPDLQWLELEVYKKPADTDEGNHFFTAISGVAVIYNHDGDPVWISTGIQDPTVMHPCDFQGLSGAHLCLTHAKPNHHFQHSHGASIILDNHYQTVHVLQTTMGNDMHEFVTTAGGTKAIVIEYILTPYDLSAFGITSGMGWVEEGLFRKLDLASHRTEFEWRSLDHTQPAVPIGDEEKVEGTKTAPLDYFHLNSVDENDDGDFLISSRHMNAIFKISGDDGRILWQLSNDESSSFALQDFQFFGQHDARWLSDNSSHTVLSFYDNGANTWTNLTSPSALVVTLDHHAATASLSTNISTPYVRKSPAMGSTQVLPNGNVLVSWGSSNSLSEHETDGKLVFNATLPSKSYRVVTAPWTGLPLEPPAMWAYSLAPHNDTPVIAYASWNGATDVHTWAFYTSTTRDGDFTLTTATRKTGFETNCTLPSYRSWVYAEAQARNGSVLGASDPVAVWSPSPALATVCDLQGCPDVVREPKQHSIPTRSRSAFQHKAIVMLLVVFLAFAIIPRFRRLMMERLRPRSRWPNRHKSRDDFL